MFTKTGKYSATSWKTAKFCSKSCWSVRGKTITKDCEWCKKPFSLPAHIMGIGKKRERKSCSTACRYRLITADRNYMWRGEKSKYNMRFRDALGNTYMYRHWRKAVKENSNNSCVNCKISGEKNMHVHHIYPLAQIIKDENWSYDRFTDLFKSPKSKLWDINNGVLLCIDCHYSLISYALQHKGFSPK